MSRVDPYVIRIPKAFLTDPEVRAWFIYDDRWKHDMWQQVTGGSGDADPPFQFEPTFSVGMEERLESLESQTAGESVLLKAFEIVSVASGSTTLTTTGNQVVICNNTALGTVTLNAFPEDGEEVKIKRRSAPVILSGTIDGRSSLLLNNRYDAPHLVYTLDAGEWSIV